jgi:16S rRNA (guanine966-N2)-methyltransferase
MTLRLSGGRRLLSPRGLATRPTPSRLRLAVMNMLAARLPGSSWLDLCCGSGAMACEALQHGAARVVAVERDRRTATLARTNLEAVAGGLNPPVPVRVDPEEVVRWLRRGRPAAEPPFDLIYADPPYAAELYGPISGAVAAGGWLGADGLLLLECASTAVPECPLEWRDHAPPRRYGQSCLLQWQLAGGTPPA